MHNASSAILCHFFYGCEFGVRVKSGGAKLPEKLESQIPDLAPNNLYGSGFWEKR